MTTQTTQLIFRNNGTVSTTPYETGRIVAQISDEGEVHIESDAPEVVTYDFIIEHLRGALHHALKIKDTEWLPEIGFLRAAEWNLNMR